MISTLDGLDPLELTPTWVAEFFERLGQRLSWSKTVGLKAEIVHVLTQTAGMRGQLKKSLPQAQRQSDREAWLTAVVAHPQFERDPLTALAEMIAPIAPHLTVGLTMLAHLESGPHRGKRHEKFGTTVGLDRLKDAGWLH